MPDSTRFFNLFRYQNAINRGFGEGCTPLNLIHSPEKGEFWECADPVQRGAGNTGNALLTSLVRHPGVSDSIDLIIVLVSRQEVFDDILKTRPGHLRLLSNKVFRFLRFQCESLSLRMSGSI